MVGKVSHKTTNIAAVLPCHKVLSCGHLVEYMALLTSSQFSPDIYMYIIPQHECMPDMSSSGVKLYFRASVIVYIYNILPSMILSSVTPCVNFSWISFRTESGSGMYLHSSSPSEWFVCEEVYVTWTSPVNWWWSTYILAKQYDLSSFLDTLMDFLFCVVFLGIVFARFVPSRQHVNRRCLISVVLYRNKL